MVGILIHEVTNPSGTSDGNSSHKQTSCAQHQQNAYPLIFSFFRMESNKSKIMAIVMSAAAIAVQTANGIQVS